MLSRSAAEPASPQPASPAVQPSAAEPASAAMATAPRRPGAPLQAGDLLAWQRTRGNRSLQRMLLQRQTAQEDKPEPTTSQESPNPEAKAADLEKRKTEARASLLEAAQRDGAMYMARAQGLSEDLREPLYEDAALTTGLRGSFHGLTLFIARMRVRWASPPSYIHQWNDGVRDKDVQRLFDLVRAYPSLRDPQMGAQEVLETELAGDPALPELKRLLREPPLQQGVGMGVNSSPKYDNKKGEPPHLVQTVSRYHFILQRTASELRVIVRVLFINPATKQPTSPSDEKLNEWRAGIDSYWNYRFRVANGKTRLNVVFVPIWNAKELTDYVISFVEGEGQSSVGANSTWYSGATGPVIAHEFGHMVGNPDEYDLPAKIEDIPQELGMSKEARERSNYQSLTGQDAPHPGDKGNTVKDSIMGDYGQVHQRHVWTVLQEFNEKVKPGDEPEFQLEGGVK